MYFKIYAFLITPQANFCRLQNHTLLIKVSVKIKKITTCIVCICELKIVSLFSFLQYTWDRILWKVMVKAGFEPRTFLLSPSSYRFSQIFSNI